MNKEHPILDHHAADTGFDFYGEKNGKHSTHAKQANHANHAKQNDAVEGYANSSGMSSSTMSSICSSICYITCCIMLLMSLFGISR